MISLIYFCPLKLQASLVALLTPSPLRWRVHPCPVALSASVSARGAGPPADNTIAHSAALGKEEQLLIRRPANEARLEVTSH
jgi:hypothetical protein